MFQSWRWKLGQIDQALKVGRLDEAARLLSEGDLQEYLPAQRLAVRVAEDLTKRARRRAAAGNAEDGWRDVALAESLAAWLPSIAEARQHLADHELDAIQESLSRDDTAGAVARIEAFEKASWSALGGGRLSTLKLVTRRLESARQLCHRGRFAEAEQQVAAAHSLYPQCDFLEARRSECHALLEKSRELTEPMHRAMAGADWTTALTLADRLLEMAPEHRLARQVRRKAWAEVGASLRDTQAVGAARPEGAANQYAVYSVDDGGNGGASGPTGERFLLWIDAVGGYLVCLGDEVVIGQAVPGNAVDLPIQGDLSRRHARIRREGEGYVIDPLQQTRVNGAPIHRRVLLADGDTIELGQGVVLQFHKPHALSATARLDFVSRHRTQPYADGVLLMAESCVMGPNWRNHVVCRDWDDDVVLYQLDGQLHCRTMDALQIDGNLCDGQGRLTTHSHVAGESFSMSLEPL
jgi:hypothetical protein